MLRRIARALVAVALVVTATVGTVALAEAPARADVCYTWGRVLYVGATGSDVAQLQIRVAGYPGYNSTLAIDGVFGPATKSAVERFQRAYGLSVDGVAGSQTYRKIYALQDGDCTPAHFSYAELNRCNSTWSGGAVSASTARANALKLMWKLEALRHALGDHPITISSGFRSYSCNTAVGGVSNSRHLYGDAADLTGTPSLCSLAKDARYHGFTDILGPGYPGHSTHTHVAYSPSKYWSAGNCGI